MAREDDSGESEVGVYEDSGREELMEAGEISPEEDAFMQGYDQTESDEEDTASDAYERAFADRKQRRRRTKHDDFEDEDY